MKHQSLIAFVWFAIAFTVAAASRPNIVVILSDDMGYSDIGCYGGEIRTPNLNALAKKGIRFTQFYNTARCCPTRAALLTGLYSHQTGVGHMMGDRGHDGYRGDLNSNCVTMAEALRPAGYRNYAVGKWHVTRHIQPEGPKHNWPLQRGFDRYYGTIHGAGSYFDPATLTRDNTPITPFSDAEYRPRQFYYTDAISDQAVRFIAEHRRQHAREPFFLYVAYTAAHWPMHALPEDIAKYRGRYDLGYAPVREERLKKMSKLGLLDAQWMPAKMIGDWGGVKDQRWEAAGMEVYAAMVDRMDQGIGRIVAQLKKSGQFDNTLVFYLQDNGGCAEGMGRAGTKEHPEQPRAERPTLKPLGPDTLLPADSVPPQTRDGFPVLMGKKVLPGAGDTYIAYGQAWANVSNTPFREYKHWVHEGGISTPLIVHWPDGIARPQRNSLAAQPAHLIDIMATCLDVSGAAYPKQFKGQPIKPFEGVSLLPALNGKSVSRAQPIFWEHEGHRAVRDGKWKLVAKENKPWELYDLAADRTEKHDLVSAELEKVRALTAAWDAWAARANVLPLGGWRGKSDLSTETRFTFKAGDRRARNEAPAIVGRGFSITANFDASGGEGVILAHGGSAHGYTLFLQEGKLTFAVRSARSLTSIATEKAVLGKHAAVARLDPNGVMKLTLDDALVASGKAAGALTTMPQDGLDVGADEGAAVGPYTGRNPFAGSVESVFIELDDAKGGTE